MLSCLVIGWTRTPWSRSGSGLDLIGGGITASISGGAAFARSATLSSLFFALLTATPQVPSASDPLQLAVNPRISHNPGSFRATALVEPDRENRWLMLSAESREYYRSSTVQLDGAEAARRHVMFFQGLPAGTYLIQARVERADGEQIVRERAVIVGTDRRR